MRIIGFVKYSEEDGKVSKIRKTGSRKFKIRESGDCGRQERKRNPAIAITLYINMKYFGLSTFDFQLLTFDLKKIYLQPISGCSAVW